MLAPDPLMLARVDEEHRTATGFAARGVDEEWWRGVVLDLDDGHGSDRVGRSRGCAPLGRRRHRLAEGQPRPRRRHEAKSAAFVPLVSEGDVVGVLVAATRTTRRSFTPAELELVKGSPARLRSRSGGTRSNEALRAALERERLIAEIGRRVRSELDLDTVLQVAVEETAKAVGVSRSFVRLGELGEPMPVLAEWNAPGVEPVGEAAPGSRC